MPAQNTQFCSYFNCTNHVVKDKHRFGFFKFPVNDHCRLEMWRENTGNSEIFLKPVEDLKRFVVCEAHFPPQYIIKSVWKKQLTKTAVPLPWSAHGIDTAVGSVTGIGNAIVLRLLQSEAKVIALDICKENLEKLKLAHPEIDILVADLSNWEETKQKLKTILPIDLLVNNAGIALSGGISTVTSIDFDRVFDVNIKSMINVTQTFVDDLIVRKTPGAVVNISSVLSKVAMPAPQCALIYSASKGAVDAFTRSLAVELGPKNIRVNAINPNFVKTKMTEACVTDKSFMNNLLATTPIKSRTAVPEDVANAVAFLLSDQAEMITGVTLPVDGGCLAM